MGMEASEAALRVAVAAGGEVRRGAVIGFPAVVLAPGAGYIHFAAGAGADDAAGSLEPFCQPVGGGVCLALFPGGPGLFGGCFPGKEGGNRRREIPERFRGYGVNGQALSRPFVPVPLRMSSGADQLLAFPEDLHRVIPGKLDDGLLDRAAVGQAA